MKYFVILLFVILIFVMNNAEARSFSDFKWKIDETYHRDGHVQFVVQKGSENFLPIGIYGKSDVTVNLHPTIGNDQTGPAKLPRGVDIYFEPSRITVADGETKTVKLIINVDENAPANLYDVQIVGTWKEEGKTPNFMGSSIRLHVGKDFGDGKIPVNFDLGKIKQFFEDGVPIQEIPCKNDYIIIIKKSTGYPACVNPETAEKLIQRGWGEPVPQYIIDDSLCLVIDKATSREKGSGVTLDRCYPLSDLENFGCNKPILAHLAKYSNLLDDEFDGYYAIEDIGLPDGVSVEKFEECVDFIYEERSSFIISRIHTLNPTEREDFIIKYTKTLLNGEFHDHAYIIDLQNEYAVGEPITFTVATWGYRHPCQSPSFVYYYETKDPVNIVFEDKFIRLCQALEESDYMYYYSELNSYQTTKALNDNVYPVFDKSGSYIVSVDDKTEYEFQIIETE